MPIGDERLHAEVVRQRAHDVVEQLADEHDALAAAHGFEQLLARVFAQIRLQHVLKIFFAEQIEPVAAHPAQQRVQKSRGEGAARGVGKRPRQRHRRPCRARRAQRSEKLCEFQVKNPTGRIAPTCEQRAFDAPIHGLAPVGADTCAHTRRALRNSCRRGKVFAHASEASASTTDRYATYSCSGVTRVAHPHPVDLVDLGRCSLMTRSPPENVAPTKQDRQHVTNCKVNIISGLPQEMRRVAEVSRDAGAGER